MPHAQSARIRALVDAGELNAAVDAAKQALHDAAGLDRADLLLALSFACTTSGHFVDGLRAAVSASEAFQAAQQRDGICDALTLVGNTLRAAGDHAAAISSFEQAETLARDLNDQLRLSKVLRSIGVACSVVGRHQHALAQLQEASALAENAGENFADKQGLRLSLINARSRHARSKATDAAARQALLIELLGEWAAFAQVCEAAGLQRLAVMARGNHGIMLREAGHRAQAIDELSGLLAPYRSMGMRPNEALCHMELGHAHRERGDHLTACTHYNVALAMLRDGGSLDDCCETLEGLSWSEEALGRHAAALAALRECRQVEQKRSDEAARNAVVQRELRVELARLTNLWAQQAAQDALTGLGNRRALDRWLGEHLPRAEQGQPLTLLLLDLDHFKQVNDRFGHGIGDRVLQSTASLLRSHCRGVDLAVRYGGEEFLLALASVNTEQALGIAHRLCEAVRGQPWQDIASGLAVSVSIGVAHAIEAQNAGDLLTLADQRLYAAKYRGRNQVVAA